MLAHPAVGGDAGLRLAQPHRLSAEPVELHSANRRQLRCCDRDAAHAHPVLGIEVVRRKCPVGVVEVRRRGLTRPRSAAVDPHEVLDRSVPELELPDRIRVVHALSDECRSLASGDRVDPARRQRQHGVLLVGCVPLAVGGVDLGRQRPAERGGSDRHCESGSRAGRANEVQGEEQEAGGECDEDERGLDRLGRPLRDPVREGSDREAVRLVVRIAVERIRSRGDEVEREHRRRDGRQDARPAALEHERGSDEEERHDVDQVPLCDHDREGRREIRRLDRGVQPEHDESGDAQRRERRSAFVRLLTLPREPDDPRDERQDPETDRKSAGGPDPVFEHPPLEEAGRDVPGERALAKKRGDSDGDADSERDGADPVPPIPRRPPASPPPSAPGTAEQDDGQHRQEDRQLRSHRDRDQQAAAAKAIDLRLGEIPAFAISRNASVAAG